MDESSKLKTDFLRDERTNDRKRQDTDETQEAGRESERERERGGKIKKKFFISDEHGFSDSEKNSGTFDM